MTTFADIKGNDAAEEVLRRMVDTSRVPHAIMLHEDPCGGGMRLAMAFISYLYCNNRHDGEPCGQCPACRQTAAMVHPDVHFIFPVNKGTVITSKNPVSEMGIEAFRQLYKENPLFDEQDLYDALGIDTKTGNISVQDASDMLGKLSLSSVSGGYRTVVIFLPERMNPAAANKLLKMLEEPPAQTLFILVTNSPDSVLVTITSRCQHIRVLPPGRGAGAVQKVPAEFVEIWNDLVKALLQRDLLAALDCSERLDLLKSREKQKAFCIFASQQLRGALMFSRGLDDIAFIEHTPVSDALKEKLGSKAYARISAALDRSALLIVRNVPAKLVFTDLINLMFVNF